MSESNINSEMTASVLSHAIMPELELISAILMETIDDLRLVGTTPDSTEESHKIAQRVSRSYVMSYNRTPFAFLWLCEKLKACPEHIRRSVRDGTIMTWEPRKFSISSRPDGNALSRNFYQLKAAN